MTTWKVVLGADGKTRVEHHALVGWMDDVVGGSDDIREARKIRDEYVRAKESEEANDKSQKELF